MDQTKCLSQAELDKRISVLRRFRELLVRQSETYKKYLTVLDKQKTDIESGNIDALISHVELEQNIVSEIHTTQKAIVPLETMYEASYPQSEHHELVELQNKLTELKTQIVERNTSNQAILKQHMELLRHEIMAVNTPFKNRSSIYASASEPKALDIKG